MSERVRSIEADELLALADELERRADRVRELVPQSLGIGYGGGLNDAAVAIRLRVAQIAPSS